MYMSDSRVQSAFSGDSRYRKGPGVTLGTEGVHGVILGTEGGQESLYVQRVTSGDSRYRGCPGVILDTESDQG